ncbi:hypothetical protein [Streptomyces sp. NPDC097610]|uniref:hypothetical protein n=1 Tax=Streptomyces sp. NPDC097610 TaxID=3157227 RepID=UPI003322D536
MRPLFRPALATDDTSGYVLAYGKDPDNHIAVRGYADLDALLSGNTSRAVDASRTLSRCAEALRTSPPCTTARSSSPVTAGHAATPTVNSAPPPRTSRPGTQASTGGGTAPWSPGVREATSATARSSNSAPSD